MATPNGVIYMRDFSGGLNLTSQQQNLNENETPDCLNVDFGLRGGFVLRGGFQSQAYDSLLQGATFLCPSYFANDVMLLAATDGSLLEWDGSTLTDTTEDLSDTSDVIRATSFNSKVYITNGRSSGSIISQSWDGSTLTTLGSTFNDDYTLPDGGDMPKARMVANHNGYLWVADTVESGVRYPHRVRFSHLQQPEDWATDDYFDVDPGDDGDPVTALVPFKDQLLVFKARSVHVVYGYSRDDFFVERLTGASGINCCRNVAYNSGVAYWISGDGQIMAYNGSGVVPLTNNLRWWVESGKIAHSGSHRVVWADGRLFMSLVAGPAEDVDWWLFVYDPSSRSLTRYDKQITDMWHWESMSAEHSLYSVHLSDNNLYRYDREYSVDIINDGVDDVVTRIDGYYRTSWITGGETASKKRWQRPRVTAAAETSTTLDMDVFHDFYENNVRKSSTIPIVTDEDSLWGTMDWGDPWAADFDDTYFFARQPSAGSSYAVQFRFSSEDNPGRWWVDSIALPFRRKQLR